MAMLLSCSFARQRTLSMITLSMCLFVGKLNKNQKRKARQQGVCYAEYYPKNCSGKRPNGRDQEGEALNHALNDLC